MELSTNGLINDSNIFKSSASPVLLGNSCDGISYKLYPFKQGDEKALSELGINDSITEIYSKYETWPPNVINFDNHDDFFGQDEKFQCNAKYEWIDGMILYIGSRIDSDSFMIGNFMFAANVVYLVGKDYEIISGFFDKSSHYQMGDCDTYAYLWDNEIVIQNCGDVSSVVIVSSI